MAITVRGMLAYSDAMNERWFEALEKAPASFLNEKVDFSFLTPLGLLTHNANIEMAWIDVVEGAAPKWARTSTKTWTELAPVLAYLKEARARTYKVLDALGEDGLSQAREPPEVPGWAKKRFTVEEILFTIFTHEQYHRGELLAAFWSRNIEPPAVDYPRFGTPLGRETLDFPA